MSNKKELDVLLHFMTVKSGKASTVPKKQPFPVNIKSIIPSYIAFAASDVTPKITLSSMESLLSTLVNTADISGFDRLKSRHFLDKNQFFLALICMESLTMTLTLTTPLILQSIMQRLVSSIEQKDSQSAVTRSLSNQIVRNDNIRNGEEKV